MSDPLIGSVKTAISGFKEAISLAEDLEGVAQQVQDLGKKELAARRDWRRKQTHVSGDYGFVNAVDEYRRVKEAMEMREQVRQEVIKRWGPAAWNEVELIEARQKDEYKKLFTEDGYDREKMFQLKAWSFGLAAIVVLIMWMTGIIHEMAVAFYGD